MISGCSVGLLAFLVVNFLAVCKKPGGGGPKAVRMITNVRIYMISNVRIYITTTVRIYMTPNVRICMTPNVQPISSNVPSCPDFMIFRNVWVPSTFSNVRLFPDNIAFLLLMWHVCYLLSY